MKQTNGRLIAVVAAVAVAAVAIGGALAYRQGPQDRDTAAAPLPAPSSTPTTSPPPAPTPSSTPTPIPSTRPTPSVPAKAPPTPPTPSTSTAAYAGPTTIELTVSKLAGGRAPQVPYLVGREVRGGPGSPVKIPGKDGHIDDIARLNTAVLAIVTPDSGGQLAPSGTDLVRIEYGEVSTTPGGSSVVTTTDQSAAAYTVQRLDAKHNFIKGGAVYSEAGGSVRKLDLPNSYNLEVLAYRGSKVYFRAADTGGGTRKLYEWRPGTTKAAVVKTLISPTAISPDGSLAASLTKLNDGSCSSVVAIATGKQLWRTCDNELAGFTPDSRTAIGKEVVWESCAAAITALEAGTGKLIRAWKGCFESVAAEDDQHVLIVAVVSGSHLQGDIKKTIIRCSVTTGHCERATPVIADPMMSLYR